MRKPSAADARKAVTEFRRLDPKTAARRLDYAGEQVERWMLEFLMQFSPARELKVCDVQQIAAHARRLSFETFTDAFHKHCEEVDARVRKTLTAEELVNMPQAEFERIVERIEAPE